MKEQLFFISDDLTVKFWVVVGEAAALIPELVVFVSLTAFTLAGSSPTTGDCHVSPELRFWPKIGLWEKLSVPLTLNHRSDRSIISFLLDNTGQSFYLSSDCGRAHMRMGVAMRVGGAHSKVLLHAASGHLKVFGFFIFDASLWAPFGHQNRFKSCCSALDKIQNGTNSYLRLSYLPSVSRINLFQCLEAISSWLLGELLLVFAHRGFSINSVIAEQFPDIFIREILGFRFKLQIYIYISWAVWPDKHHPAEFTQLLRNLN